MMAASPMMFYAYQLPFSPGANSSPRMSEPDSLQACFHEP